MIRLYEYGPTRSARCRWTFLELGIDFESISSRELIGSPELLKVHPLGKLPALEVDGKPLFESAAICTWAADQHPEKGLIGKPGSWERALHDQWTAFILSELEAYLWSNAKHTWFYPEEKRVPAVLEGNNVEIGNAIRALEGHLEKHDYLVADSFSVTDIIAGYAVNWANKSSHLSEAPKTSAYLDRLYEREHCPLSRD
jgi:glutathione S-transferase